jgi:hypothetical protein
MKSYNRILVGPYQETSQGALFLILIAIILKRVPAISLLIAALARRHAALSEHLNKGHLLPNGAAPLS